MTPTESSRRYNYRATCAAIRAPLLPVECYADVLEDEDPLARLRDLLASSDEIRSVICLASPSLGHALDRSVENDATDEAPLVSALAYLARLSMRSTPYAALATVSLLNPGRSTDGPPTLGDIKTRTRPDYGWMYDHASSIEKNGDLALSRLFVRSSGTCSLAGGRLRVFDAARVEAGNGSYMGRPIPTSLNNTPAVALVRELAADAVPCSFLVDNLCERLASSAQDAALLILKLIDLGVLISELRLAPDPQAPHRYCEIIERVFPSDVAAYERALSTCAAVDGAERFSVKATLVQEATNHLRALRESEHYLQMDATREFSGAVPSGLTQQVLSLFETLAANHVTSDTNGALAHALRARYNEGREIPLLQLLDSSGGFDIETKMNEHLSSRADPRDEVLFEIAADAVATGAGEILLETTPYIREDRTVDWDSLAPAYEAMVQVLRADDATLRPAAVSGFYEGAGRSLARFADVLPDDAVVELMRANRASESGGELDVELFYLPSRRRTLNIGARPNAFEYSIAEGLYCADRTKTLIPLDDIVVGVRDDRAYLRSLSRNALLKVHQSHMLNPARGSRLARIFHAISSGPCAWLGFDWKEKASKFPRLPRVLLHRAVLSYERWIVPRSIASDFGSTDAMDWRAKWNVPERVYLSQGDNRLLLNLRHAASLAHLAKAAKHQPQVRLEEPLPGPGDAWLRGEKGSHVGEIVVPIRRCLEPEHRAAAKRREVPKLVPRTVYQRPLGSEWIYARCYLPIDAARPFLSSALGSAVTGLSDCFREFHYILYADPEFHVRVRFRASGEPSALIQRFTTIARQWMEDGLLSTLEFGTYDREVERYGGVDAIAHAERIFTVDSLYSLRHINALWQTDSLPEIFADVALFCLALDEDVRGVHDFLSSVVGRRQKLDRPTWLAIRQARTTLHALQHRYDDVREPLRALRNATSKEAFMVARRALLHMHNNRIGIASKDEERALHATLALVHGVLQSKLRKAEIVQETAS